MTVTLNTGHGVDYLLNAVAQGRENYYLDAVAEGEPPGRWYGAGAAAFGLTGEVAPDDMRALYEKYLDPRDEAFHDKARWAECAALGARPYQFKTTDERLEELMAAEPDALPERVKEMRIEAEKGAKQSVNFIDATFSVQKSVTVLHTAYHRAELEAHAAGDVEAAAAWKTHRLAVEESIWEGNRAFLDYLADHAGYSRVGHHGGGAGRWVDAHDWTIASFFQHTSREEDPQLHIHNAILNRVVCADDEVRTLDSRAIHHWRGAAAVVAERTTQEHLIATLGVRFAMRPDGKAREIVGVAQRVMDTFSTRRRAITPKQRELVEAFEAKFGRKPNSLEMTRLAQQATLATRKPKNHSGEALDQRLARWDQQLRSEVADGLTAVRESVHGQATGEPGPAEKWSVSGVLAEAAAQAQASQAAFTHSDAARAIDSVLPDSLGGLPGSDVAVLVDSLSERLFHGDKIVRVTVEESTDLPEELLLTDGRSAYQAPSGARYSTAEHVRAERTLRDAAVVRGHQAVSTERVRGWLDGLAERGITLGDDQRAAVEGVLTSGAAMEVLIGPAGTGKSYTLGHLSTAWADLTGGRVIALTTSQVASDVLTEDGVTARNISRWLAAQKRVEEGRAKPGDAQWRLTGRDILVVDEAAMVSREHMTEIKQRVDGAGAKSLLAGDPAQLGAVGAGGVMRMLAGEAITYELVEVRRFDNAWERTASLRLRRGDQSVIDDYDEHGRVIDGGTVEAAGFLAGRAWLGDHLAGLDSIIVVNTNEDAAKLSAHIRAELVALGRVTDSGVDLNLQGLRAGVGDLIQLRKTDQHLGLSNRARYRVAEIRPDGAVVADPIRVDDVSVTLQPEYVRDHVALAYAATVNSCQGMTVDTAHGVIRQGTQWSALYVALTRGRQRSTAYVSTRYEAPDAPTGQTQQVTKRQACEVLRGLTENIEAETQADKAAIVLAEEDAERAASAETLVDRYGAEIRYIERPRLAELLDGLAATGQLTEEQRIALAADPDTQKLAWIVRSAELAGHDPAEVLATAVGEKSLDGSRSYSHVIHHRITERLSSAPAPIVDELAQASPKGLSGEWSRRLAKLDGALADRRRELSTRVVERQPQWAVEALGPTPEDPVERAEWEHKAGIVELAREATKHHDPAVALGPAPETARTERRAVWHAAWRALGWPDASREEAELSEGALRARIRAGERERAWAPEFVGKQLRATAQAVARHRQDAAYLATQADATHDPAGAERLRQQATDRQALAEVLTEQERRLELAHEARGEWYLETAETLAAAKRAEKELTNRQISVGAEDDRVTAAEWLEAEKQARREDDAHRPVTEHDVRDEIVMDVRAETVADHRSVDDVHEVEPTSADQTADRQRASEAGTDTVSRRENEDQADSEVQPHAEKDPEMPADVPSMSETAISVLRAQQVLDEIADRRSAEATHEADVTEDEQRSRDAAWQSANERETGAQADREHTASL